ncbi:MAG: hypothetical protein JWO91_1202, partial [Acidobacteriaceae bacterium]|nr:hypothetical protein [Acidobacteriaceae bacterium]
AFLLIFVAPACVGYSVLTHEEVVDLLWKDQLQPMLLARFPKATPDDLKTAHAYAYGGSLLQDMGYYPFGNKYFSDLLHYVRTGDFVIALLQQSSDINEYAFALGGLAHYAADNCGHPVINQVVAIDFPKLKQKYGDHVTYVDNPKAHIRTEFGFDMVQVAKGHYTSDRYHDFIGFSVSKPLLERAFLQTYGMNLSDVLTKEDLAIGSFRRSISIVIPEMTRVALINRKKEVIRDTPNLNEKQFLYHLSRKSYQKEWGKEYRQPGFGSRVLAFVLKIVPKIGPFKALAFKIPSTKTEDMYVKSINTTVDRYGTLLRDQKQDQLQLQNLDFDTGKSTKAGEYSLADKTYAHLLDDLDKHKFDKLTPELRKNILDFYDGAKPPLIKKKKDIQQWAKTQQELQELQSHPDHVESTSATGNPVQ